MTVHLEPGRFYAGISLPFFVTHAMVQHKLEGLGFTNISFHQRAESNALKVDPKKYPTYSDDWNEWIEADWAGPKKDLEFEKHWAWLLVVPTATSTGPSDPKASLPGAENPESGFTKPDHTTGLILLGLLVVGFGLLLRRTS